MDKIGRQQPAGWLVYLNGIETPAETCSVSSSTNNIAQAQVTFPPDVLLRRIGAEDRVRLTVFYYDTFYEDLRNPGPAYRLLFDGEIVGYNYTNSEKGRQLAYVAVDFLAVLTQVTPSLIFNTKSLENASLNSHHAAGVSAVAASIAPTWALFNMGLASGELITKPSQFVDNVVRLIMGEGSLGTSQSTIVTHWFSRWEKRVKFRNRFVPAKLLEDYEGTGVFPLLRAAQDDQTLKSLAAYGDRIVNSSSFYELVISLLQAMYFELSPMLAPPCVSIDATTREVVGAPGVPLSVPSELALASYVTKPQMFFGFPPKCNVIWPSMVHNHAYNEDFATQPTRTYVGDPYLFDTLTDGKAGGQGAPVEKHAMTAGYPEIADRLLRTVETGGDTSHHNFLVFAEEFYKGPVYNSIIAPPWVSLLSHNDDNAEGTGLTQITKLYASMEHYRTRYARRNGSVNMHFNPYVVTGLPMVVIDEPTSNHHVFSYLASVTHSLTQSSMSTQINYTYGQTFDDFFETLITQRAVAAPAYKDIQFAPMHPLAELRDQFQRKKESAEFYQMLLWHNQNIECIFDYDLIIGVEGADEDVDDLHYDLATSNAISHDERVQTPKFLIKDAYHAIAQDPVKAMRYASRPVCSMEEYIDFQQEFGVRDRLIEPTHPREGKVGKYYVQILKFVPGPGLPPGYQMTGELCDVLKTDTRKDWGSRIHRFRNKVYYERHPHKA